MDAAPWGGWPWLARDYLRAAPGGVREIRTERVHGVRRAGTSAVPRVSVQLHLHAAPRPAPGGPVPGTVRVRGETLRLERTLRTVSGPGAQTGTGGAASGGPELPRTRGAATAVRRGGAWLPEPRVLPGPMAGGFAPTLPDSPDRVERSPSPRPDVGGAAAAPMAQPDVNRIADQVMTTLDRRLTAYRERRGRSV